MSQEELAARIQAMGIALDQSALSRIERGQKAVTDIEVLAICRALGVEVGQLFAGLDVPA